MLQYSKFILKFLPNDKGLTIVELLIAIALLLIVLSLGFSLFFFGTGSFETGTARAGAQQQARLVDEYFKAELRNAGRISFQDDVIDNWEHNFKLEDKVLYNSGNKITEKAINDVQIRLESEEQDGETRYLLDYVIHSEFDGREYTLENQILLNNIYSQEQIDGIESDFKRFAEDGPVLNYDFDADYPRLNVSPNTVTEGTYGGNDHDPLIINLYLYNEEFVQDIGTEDFELKGDALDSNPLEPDAVDRVSDSRVDITIDCEISSVNNENGSITVTAKDSALTGENSLSDIIIVEEQIATEISIEGPDTIYIPEEGSQSETYKAEVLDQAGRVIKDEIITWSLENGIGNGITIDDNNSDGEVTVTNEADEGSFTVVATSDTNNDIEGTIEVDLLQMEYTIELADPSHSDEKVYFLVKLQGNPVEGIEIRQREGEELDQNDKISYDAVNISLTDDDGKAKAHYVDLDSTGNRNQDVTFEIINADVSLLVNISVSTHGNIDEVSQ